jgi:hypothetical protein
MHSTACKRFFSCWCTAAQVSKPLRLLAHQRRVQDLGWATHDRAWLCTCGDDGNAFMWTTDEARQPCFYPLA